MSGATREEQIKILLEMKDFQSKMDAINKLFTTSIGNAKNLGQVVDAINTKFDNLSKVASKANKTINYNIDSNSTNKIVETSSGTMVSPTGRGKAFKEYQQAAIDEVNAKIELTNEIKEDTKERKRLRQQNADTARTAAEARQTRENKREDQSTAAYAARMDKLAEAKLLNAKAAQAGALNNNLRYQTGKALIGVGNTVSNLGVGGRITGDALNVIGSILKAPAVGFAVALTTGAKAVADFSSAAIRAYADIESTKTQLGVVFSSQTQSDSMFGEISQYAVKSPFGIQQTSELAILLKQSGVYATDLMDTLRMIGDTAGGNMEKMKRIANNYAQIVSIGKASMLDMRQFAYAGIPIFEAVSKELGVSQQELRKLISDGKVTSDIIEKVFKDLTGINGIFENATEKGAKTLKARLQNLSDAKQLAMASVGEGIMNIGVQTGGDSYGLRLVSWAEKIYQDIHEKVDTRNIEKSVKTIENRETKVEQIQNLIKYLEENPNKDNKDLLPELKQILKGELNKRDIDKDRAIYSNSYDSKAQIWLDAVENGETRSLKELKAELAKVNTDIANYNALYSYGSFRDEGKVFLYGYDVTNGKTPESKEELELSLQAYKLQQEKLQQLIEAFKRFEKLEEKEVQAHKETNVINAQQLAFDKANKAVDKEHSYAKGFQELYSLYTQQDEYKKKKEEEELAWLTESKKTLKELLTYKNKEGNIDITKMSYSKYLEYLDEDKRVLDAGNKLSIVTGKNYEDRDFLANQYEDIFDKTIKELRKRGTKDDLSMINQLQKMNGNIDKTADDETYFEQFAASLSDELGVFDKTIKELNKERRKRIKEGDEKGVNETEERIKFYENLKNGLIGSTFKYDAPSEDALKAILDALNKGSTSFVPLWKRILSENTGLSTNVIKNTKETLDLYRDDLAVRNTSKNVFSAALKDNYSYSDLLKLYSPSKDRLLKLRGDDSLTYQTDWKQLSKNVKDFAMELSSSTKIIDAYTEGLQNQYDTYNNLFTSGLFQGETLDITASRTTFTAKQAKNFFEDAGDQLVNAFGEKLIDNDTGQQVWYKNGTFYSDAKMTKEATVENVSITGNLFEWLKTELPNIRKDLTEAQNRQFTNKRLESLSENERRLDFIMKLRRSSYGDDSDSFIELASNLDDYESNYRTNIENQVSFLNNILSKLIDSFASTEAGFENVSSWLEILGGEGIHLESLDGVDLNEVKEMPLTEQVELIKRVQNEVNDIKDTLRNIFMRPLTVTVDTKGPVKTDKKESIETSALNRVKNNAKDVVSYSQDPEEISRIRDYEEKAIKNYLKYEINSKKISNLNENMFETEKGWRGFKNRILHIDGPDFKTLEADVAKQKLLFSGVSETKVNAMSTKELTKTLSLTEKLRISLVDSFEELAEIGEKFSDTINDALSTAAKGAYLAPMEAFGKYLVSGNKSMLSMKDAMKDVRAELLSTTGQAMKEAGWSLVSLGAKEENIGYILGGLALAGAGGVASGMSSALTEKDDTQEKLERLEALKNSLADLIEQARQDALYYEKNMRHKTALGINDAYTSVNDVVITKRGDIIKTSPDDYLFATKTPQTLGNAGVNHTNVSISIVNNSSASVTPKESIDSDGNSVIEFLIEDKIANFIASSKGDEAFGVRESRLKGFSTVM